MKRLNRLTFCSLLIIGQMGLFLPQAQAGPLLDWFRGLRNRCSLNRPAPAYPMTAAMPSACGLQPGQCQVNCQQTCSRTVVNYVPYTAYRTSWDRVPVTQYRPVTSSDPATGCTVTCMKPCTTYTWQQKQEPYTTYRPVYRQETYKVPVSYITSDCSGTAGCATCPTPQMGTTANYLASPGAACSTCTVPSMPNYGSEMPPTVGPSTTMVAPNGTLGTTGNYSTTTPGGYYSAPIYSGSGTTPTPADIPPSLDAVNPQNMNRPIIESLNSSSWNASPATSYPRAASTPVRKDWDYSPVRLASYSESVDGGEVRGGFQGSFLPKAQSATRAPATEPAQRANADWTTKTW